MQSWLSIDPALTVLVQVLITFIVIISIGLFRFSTGTRYKLWSIGWTLFTIAAVSGALVFGEGLTITDIITAAGMIFGSMFLIDGSNEKSRRGKDLVIYPILLLISTTLVLTGLFFNLEYPVVFTPIGIFSTYACWFTVIKLRKSSRIKNIDYQSLLFGFTIWGFSTLLFLIGIWVDTLAILAILMTTGISITGASMLTYLFETKTDDLRVQYAISQLMSGILNHDMRNYVGSLSESVEQALIPDSDREFWLGLMLEITQSMTRFIADIRHITASLSRFELESEPVSLQPILDEVKARVEREYDLNPNQIKIDVLDADLVMTSDIVKELLWNIMDNSFKQKSHTLEITKRESSKNRLVLEISDTAGGMTTEMHDFLNNKNALYSRTAPGTGLGLILIRGLSQLCKVDLHVQDRIIDTKVVGTVFTLEFERAIFTDPALHTLNQLTNSRIVE